MDLSCEDNKCLICNSELVLSGKILSSKNCINNCMKISFINQRLMNFYIFNKPYSGIEEIEEQINYWKENERYLAKILGETKYDLL